MPIIGFNISCNSYVKVTRKSSDDDDDDDNNNNNNNNNDDKNNNNNNNDNVSKTRKYWVDVQWDIVSSHGERDSH